MNVTRLFSIVIVCGVGLMSVDSSIAQQSTPANVPVNEINSATQSLAEGKIDEALEQYRSAAEVSGDNHTLSYNRGIALYRQGNIDEARQQFLHALDSTDTTLAAKSWFNLGNCDYSDAVASAEQDRPAAISSLGSAISKYRRSLKLDRADNDARANIELAAKLMEQLQQQEDEEEQQQDQQQQDQQQQDQTQDDSQSQQQDQQENQQQDENQNQSQSSDDESKSGDQDEQQESAAENQGNDPSDPSEEKSAADSDQKQEAQNGQQSTEQNENQDAQNESEQEQEQEQDASEQNQSESSADNGDQQEQQNAQPQQGDQAQPNESQPERNSAMGQGVEQENDPEDQGQGEQQGTPAAAGYGTSHAGTAAGEMDKQEAMKMLQSIRDRDLLRRIDKLRETKRRHIPVERDW